MPEPTRAVILTALRAEYRVIRKAIGDRPGVELLVIGMKAVRIPRIPPNVPIIVAGVGGALDPILKIGDLVLDAPDGVPLQLGPWRMGRIHSADEVVTSPEAKAELFKRTGADVIDMEHFVVRSRYPNSTPIIGLRSVSDTADMSVNTAVLRLVDATGRPRPVQIAATLMRQPSLIPHLQHLNANMKIALHNLGLGVAALLDRFPFDDGVAYASPNAL